MSNRKGNNYFNLINKKFIEKKEYNFINSNIYSPKYNENSNNIKFAVFKEGRNNIQIMLDINGKLFYRRYINELLINGQDWSELKYFEGKYDELRKFLDFDIHLNNIYAINPNSKVLIISNFDIPRLFDK